MVRNLTEYDLVPGQARPSGLQLSLNNCLGLSVGLDSRSNSSDFEERGDVCSRVLDGGVLRGNEVRDVGASREGKLWVSTATAKGYLQ